MRLNERKIQWMIENDLLLREQHELDGSMAKVWSKMKGPIDDFGKVLSSTVKLIGTDLGFLVKLTVGSLFLASNEDIKKWKQQKDSKRKSLLSDIARGASWDNMDNNAKLMGFMLNPAGAMLGASANWGAFELPNLRATIGEYGGDSIPGLGWLFDPDLKFESDTWNRIKNAKDDEEIFQILGKKIESLEQWGEKKDKNQKNTSDVLFNRLIPGMPNAAAVITGLYIAKDQLEESFQRTAVIISEGAEGGESADPDPEAAKKLMKVLKQIIDIEIRVDGDAVIELKEEELKTYLGDIPKTISTIAEMTTTDDVKTFFACIEKLAKALPEEKQKKVDVSKVAQGFEKAKQTLKDDRESMEKLKKEFEKNKKEATEQSVDAEIDKIVLSSFKGQYIQELKSGLTDFLESAHEEIWDGMTEKEIKAQQETSTGKEYIKLCKKYEDEITSAITKIGQV